AAWAVTVKPSQLGDRRREVLGRLARLLGTTRAKLETRIADYTGSPLRGIPVAEDVPTRQLFYLTEHADRFPGVAPEVLALREYPAGAAAAHVLGYVGEISPEELKQRSFRGYEAGDIVGKAGVELTYDKWLRGRDGVQDLEVNAAGEVGRALGGRPPRARPRPPADSHPRPPVECRAVPGRWHAGRPAAARQPAGRHLPGSGGHR